MDLTPPAIASESSSLTTKSFSSFIYSAESWWYRWKKLKMNVYENKSEIGLGIPCLPRDRVAVSKHISHDCLIEF